MVGVVEIGVLGRVEIGVVGRVWPTKLPDFVIGKYKWDNWLVHEALLRGIAVVDATEVSLAVHQTHPVSPTAHTSAAKLANLKLAGITILGTIDNAGWKMHRVHNTKTLHVCRNEDVRFTAVFDSYQAQPGDGSDLLLNY